VYHSVPIKRTSQIRFQSSWKKKSLRESQALLVDVNGTGMMPGETANQRNCLFLLDGRSDAVEEIDMTTEDEHEVVEASPSSETPLKPAAPPSMSSDKADYERLMKAFFRQPPSRIPLPSAWRNAAVRTYSFRGPTSPFQNVATAPVPAAKKSAMYGSFVYATQPRRNAASRVVSPSTGTTAIPQPDALNESNARPLIGGHTSGSVVPRPLITVPKREVEKKETLPPGWSPIQPFGQTPLSTEHTDFVRSVTAMSGDTIWYDAAEEAMAKRTTN
jgi:hypothetical protein